MIKDDGEEKLDAGERCDQVPGLDHQRVGIGFCFTGLYQEVRGPYSYGQCSHPS